MNHPERDPFDMLVADADPVRALGLGSDGDLAPILAAMRADVTATAEKSRPVRRRRRFVVTGIFAATLAAGGTAAASGLIPLHTGERGAPGMTENDTSEFLRMDSPELDQAIDTYGREFPLPPGGDWSAAKKALRAGEPTAMQAKGLRGALALQAACQWQMYWLDSHTRHDTRKLRDAQRTLDEVPTWSAIAANDGGGTVDHLRQVAVAARRGDPGPVRQWVAANCTPGMWHPEGAR